MVYLNDIPEVTDCAVGQCAYNVHHACHARAITIGDGVHPGCDTYFKSSVHSAHIETNAGVGACKVSACMHNDDFECQAKNVRVGVRRNSIECLTFKSV